MGKKIKITEAQARSLGLINENVDMLAQFEQFCKVKIEEVNRLYSTTTMMNVGDIMTNPTTLIKLSERLSNIEDTLRTASRKVENTIIGHPDENDLDSRLDKAEWGLKGKISSLQLMIVTLDNFRELSVEHEIRKDFIDIKPIDITSSQS
jgi:hypothetical protein